MTSGSDVVRMLREAVPGRLITPQDAGYDEARTVFYGGFDRRPAAIARVADAAEVARVVAVARQSGLPLAVRSGGHSVAGHCVADGGIVLDLSPMRRLEIDPGRRLARAQTGITAGEYTQAAGEHGLATGFGDTASVGIGGLTLGGGVGYLARKHGLTIDTLRGAEVVTADGETVYADAENHPDLFWALRGGGGNFGVATRFDFELQPLETVLGGMLLLLATLAVIASFVAEAESAPDELTTIANIMPAPPMPFLPVEHHGQLILLAMLVHAGAGEAGERALAPFRSLAEPIADLIRPMRYPEIYTPEEPAYHPLAAARTMFVDSIGIGEAETILDRLRGSSATMAVTQVRVLGGAVSRVPSDATAYAHRQRRMMVNVAALYQETGQRQTHDRWAGEFAAALRHGEPAAYVNFLGDEGEDRIRQAYPDATWSRLRSIKRRYDPDNLFRLNQNIPPASRPDPA